MKKTKSPDELAPQPLTVSLPTHVVRDLKEMEKCSKQSIDEIVRKALLMFIATHSDFLGKNR